MDNDRKNTKITWPSMITITNTNQTTPETKIEKLVEEQSADIKGENTNNAVKEISSNTPEEVITNELDEEIAEEASANVPKEKETQDKEETRVANKWTEEKKNSSNVLDELGKLYSLYKNQQKDI